MSTGKTYSTKYLLDSNNNRGTEGQILSTTSTGIDWVDANSVPGTGLWVTSGNNIYNSNSGNVGIKTTSPANPLSINFAPNGISSITTSNNSTAWNTSSAIMLEGASNSNGLGFGVSGTANDRKSWIQSGHPDQQYASSLGTLAINPLGGNVGIGTTSPLAKLHAKSGDSGVSSVDTGTSAIIESDTTNYLRFLNPDSANAGLVWTSPSDNFAAYLRWKYSSRVLEMATAKTNSSISFSTGNADERMRITSAGNVGIGTTSPGSRLTVSGTNNATSEITLINTNPSTDNDWSITPFYNDQTLRFRTNSAATTVMTLKDNGNVGIGTPSPSGPLHVKGSTDDVVVYIDTNNNAIGDTASIQFNDRAKVGWFDSAVYLGDNGQNKDIKLKVNTADIISLTSNTERMRITSAGNVGIGTTNPVTLLDIRGAGTTSNPATSGTTPSTGTRFRIASSTGASAVIDFGISSSGRSWLQSTDRTDLGAEYPFLLNPNGGNVGIGTTSPEVKLTIKGDALNTNQPVRITNSVTDTHTGLFLNNTGGTVGEKYGMQFGGYNQYSIGGIFGVLDSVSGNTSGDITFDFGNGTSAGSLVEKMRITHEGNVGINCTPSYKLQWSDGTRTGLLDTNIGAVVIGSVSNDALALYTNLTEKMRIDSSGVIKFNAYDGTNNTGSPTHILGTDASGNVVKSTAGSSIGPWLPLAGGTMTGVTQFNDHTNYGDQVYARFGASQDLQIFHNGTDSFIDNYTGSLTIRNRQDDGHIVFTCDDGSGGLASYLTLNGNNTHAYFTNPGNVGIGTTSPNVPLEVHGADITTRANTTAQSVLRLVRDVTDSNYTSTKDSAVDFMLSRQQTVNNNLPYTRLDIRLAGTTDSSTPSLDVMSLLHNGNVGIGTTSPSYKLHVDSDVASGNVCFIHHDNPSQSSGTVMKIRSDAGDNDGSALLNIENNTGNALYVRGDRRVGVGTTSPVSKLEVSSGPGANGDCILTVSADTDNSTATSSPKLLMLQKGSTKTSLIEMDSSNRTHFSNSDGYYFSGGNVGIGTTSPSQKLEVAGSVAVTGTNVTVANASNPYIYINDTNAGAGIFQQEGNTTRIGSDSNTQVVLVQNNATAVTIDTSKNVGIGTTSPDYKLEVNGTLGVNRTDGIIFAGSAAPGYGNKITVDTSNDFIFSTSLPSAPYTTSEKMRIANGGATTFASTVTATNFILSSDERLKENVEKVCDNRVKADWKTFELKTEKGQKRYGVIAQELEKTNPEFVREDSQGFKSVAYIDLLIAKIAELEARLEKLEK